MRRRLPGGPGSLIGGPVWHNIGRVFCAGALSTPVPRIHPRFAPIPHSGGSPHPSSLAVVAQAFQQEKPHKWQPRFV
ncbi:protein of unknown function [Micropruina glycogenica]|uniref:Uncharacterized protein n=1 Tax=Micropruina glycogenica TaxID=75385 RepID=A0A2N9JFL3_9ACTN|nr:protein of unknown function [Micropruina glycogenica]